jgi:hypothetical protein
MLKLKFFVFTILIIIFVSIKADAVCDLRTLKIELKQDLDDNGILDCLRIIEPHHFVAETEDQKNLRLAAQWDTSCAFESSANWKEKLKLTYGITNIYNSKGEVITEDSEHEADMCEIVRAAMMNTLSDITDPAGKNQRYDFIEKIDCAGPEGIRDGPRICAVSGGSYYQKDAWSIFLYPAGIKFGKAPNFVRILDSNTPVNSYDIIQKTRPDGKLLFDAINNATPNQLGAEGAQLANMIDSLMGNTNQPLFVL